MAKLQDYYRCLLYTSDAADDLLCVGRFMFDRVSEPELIEESHHIYSGLTGWFIRQYLSHPPAGARLENLESFAREQQLQNSTPTLMS